MVVFFFFLLPCGRCALSVCVSFGISHVYVVSDSFSGRSCFVSFVLGLFLSAVTSWWCFVCIFLGVVWQDEIMRLLISPSGMFQYCVMHWVAYLLFLVSTLGIHSYHYVPTVVSLCYYCYYFSTHWGWWFFMALPLLTQSLTMGKMQLVVVMVQGAPPMANSWNLPFMERLCNTKQ